MCTDLLIIDEENPINKVNAKVETLKEAKDCTYNITIKNVSDKRYACRLYFDFFNHINDNEKEIKVLVESNDYFILSDLYEIHLADVNGFGDVFILDPEAHKRFEISVWMEKYVDINPKFNVGVIGKQEWKYDI